MAKSPKKDGTYSEAETARRRDAIVRNMIATPPKPNTVAKKKKVTSRAKPSPNKRAIKKATEKSR